MTKQCGNSHNDSFSMILKICKVVIIKKEHYDNLAVLKEQRMKWFSRTLICSRSSCN